MKLLKMILAVILLGIITQLQAQTGLDFLNKQVEGYPPYDDVSLVEILEDKGDTLLVAHKYGEIAIPKNPQRLVVDYGLLEVCLSLGIKPTAAFVYGEVTPLLQDELEGIQVISVGDAVNLETVVALNPDLLLGHFYFGGYDERLYKQLSNIAPTVILRELPHWSLTTRDVATLLGKEAELETLFSDYSERMSAASAEIKTVIGDSDVALLQLLPEAMYLSGPGTETNGKFLPAYFGTFLYRDLALKPDESILELVGNQEVATVSLELLPKITAEVIVLVPTSRPGEPIEESETYKDFTSSPLFKTLPASQNNRVYTLGPIPENYYTTLEFVGRLVELVKTQ
jgi:iron complex transport system substrate-binding protein